MASFGIVYERDSQTSRQLDIPGLYQEFGFNFKHSIDLKLNSTDRYHCILSNYKGDYSTCHKDPWDDSERHLNPYGVVNDPEQFKLIFKELIDDPSRFFAVGLTWVGHKHEHKFDDWCWHKWGSFIYNPCPSI